MKRNRKIILALSFLLFIYLLSKIKTNNTKIKITKLKKPSFNLQTDINSKKSFNINTSLKYNRKVLR